MKEGDLVRVTDFSWAAKIVDGKLREKWSEFRGERDEKWEDREWEILAIDCKLPSSAHGKEHGIINDTIICSLESNEVVFIVKENLRKIKKCSYCEHAIEEK